MSGDAFIFVYSRWFAVDSGIAFFFLFFLGVRVISGGWAASSYRFFHLA